MENNQTNPRSMPENEIMTGDTAVYKAESLPPFKRTLVPLNEYASREGLSSDIVEKQGQLGVIQIRKFKGRKFVVDVPQEQITEYENEDKPQITIINRNRSSTLSSKLLTACLMFGFIIIIAGFFWLYAKTKIEDLTAENKSLQNRINEMNIAHQSLKEMQEQLAAAKVEFTKIQNRIATSKTDMEKIQGDLNKTKNNLDAVQSELASIQGQTSLSKVEIESIQHNLNESKNQLDILSQQNTRATK